MIPSRAAVHEAEGELIRLAGKPAGDIWQHKDWLKRRRRRRLLQVAQFLAAYLRKPRKPAPLSPHARDFLQKMP